MDKNSLKCRECDQLYMGKETSPPCGKCGMPMLLGENFEVYCLARRALLVSRDSMSGKVDSSGIHHTLVASGIFPGDPKYGEYAPMMMYYIAINMNAETRRKNKEQSDLAKSRAKPTTKVLRAKHK